MLITLLDVRNNCYANILIRGIYAPMVVGATTFDVIPNFSISLLDDHLDKILIFQFGTQYLDMKPGSRTHALFFALYGGLFNIIVPLVKYTKSDKFKACYSLLWKTESKGF